jgi:hypothetical protein
VLAGAYWLHYLVGSIPPWRWGPASVCIPGRPAVGRWLAASASPDDSVVAPDTHANVVAASGLQPAYPYARAARCAPWTRSRPCSHAAAAPDGQPHVGAQLGPAPQLGPDGDGRVEPAVQRNYRRVASVCGHEAWLHRGVRCDPSPSRCHGLAAYGLDPPVRAGRAEHLLADVFHRHGRHPLTIDVAVEP